MKENLEQEQRVEESTQTFAGVPGVPGGPTYMEVFPDEASNDSTKYDSKSAIWNSGAPGDRFKNVSFADSTSGFQFKVDTISAGYPGYPGFAGETNLSVRVKRSNSSSYNPWYKIYHEGNKKLFFSIPAIAAKADKTYVDSALANKADSTVLTTKADKTYVDSGLAAKMDKISIDTKADKTYVDANLALKADAAEFTVAKQDLTFLKNNFPLKADKKIVEERLALKADKKTLFDGFELKADKKIVEENLALKADKKIVEASLALKADKKYVDDAIAGISDITDISAKADKTYVDEALANKADLAALNVKADKTYVDDAIANKNDNQNVMYQHPDTATSPLQDFGGQNKVVYCSSETPNEKGLYAIFGDNNEHAMMIQAHEQGSSEGPRFSIGQIYKVGVDGGHFIPFWSRFELLHSGNTQIMNVYSAGRIGPYNGYTVYMGEDVTVTSLGDGRYKVVHSLGTSNYMVNVTPIGVTAQRFTVIGKTANDFDILFEGRTVAEIQIMTYNTPE